MEKKRFANILQQLDDKLEDLEQVQSLKKKEWEKKLDEEVLMIEKCNDYIHKYQSQLDGQKEQLDHKKEVILRNSEDFKLKEQLQSITKEQEVLAMIAESYKKEIQRKQDL